MFHFKGDESIRHLFKEWQNIYLQPDEWTFNEKFQTSQKLIHQQCIFFLIVQKKQNYFN